MSFLRQLLMPLAVATFLAVVFSPGVDWLHRRRVPRGIGAVLVLLLITAILIGSVAAVLVGVVDQADNLRDRFDEVVANVEDLIGRGDIGDLVDSALTSFEQPTDMLGDGFASAVGSALGTASGLVSGAVLGAVLLYYLLKDGPSMVESIARRSKEGSSEQAERILDSAAGSVRSYVKGRTILAIVQGVVIGVVAMVFGVPLAVAIAIVNIIGGYIPYIGGLIGGAFAVLMALSEGGLPLAVIMFVAVMAVSVGLENLLEPKLLGDKLDLHPVIILFATIAGGLFIGLVGFFLAAPLASIGRTLFRELAESGFFDADNSEDRASAAVADLG